LVNIQEKARFLVEMDITLRNEPKLWEDFYMNNLKNWLNRGKFLGKIGLLSVLILSMMMPACNLGSDDVNPADTNNTGLRVLAVDVSGETEWDYMFLRSDGVKMFVSVNEKTKKPASMWVQPDKNSDAGLSMIFKENGLPDLMEINNHLFYFANFTGYTYDLAVIKPNGDIEYRYDIQTETNFDNFSARSISARSSVSASRSLSIPKNFDPNKPPSREIDVASWFEFDIYDAASFALGLGTCVAVVAAPVLAPVWGPRCVSWIIGTVANFAITVLTDVLLDGEAQEAVAGYLSGFLDIMDCLSGNFNYECAVSATSLAHSCFNGAFGDYVDKPGIMEKINEAVEEIEEIKPPPIYVFFDVTANGSSQSTTTKLTLTFDKDISGLNAGDIDLHDYSTGAVKGGLTGKGNGVYELEVSGITRSGYVKVSLYKYGYRASDKQVRVSVPSKPLEFKSVTADGSEGTDEIAGEKTTKLTLTFNQDIEYIYLIHITLTPPGHININRLVKTGTEGVYELLLYYVNENHDVKVSVSVDDYFINGPSSHTVTVYAKDGSPPLTDNFTLISPTIAYTPTSTAFRWANIKGYCNGMFFALDGDKYRIIRSTDGLNWTPGANLGTTNNFSNMVYGDGVYVIPLNGIGISTDGISWGGVSNVPSGINDIRTVAYGGGKFIAGGLSGMMAWSTDGRNWTAVADSKFGTSNIYAIAYGGGKFVAVGDTGNNMAWSTDGITWTAVTSSPFNYVQGIAYGGGKFVAVNSDGKLAWSTDGANWTAATASYNTSQTASGSGFHVTYGNGKFVVVGTIGRIATSTDGINWTNAPSPFGNTYIDNIVYGDGMFIATGVGDGGGSVTKVAWSK
jgi:hypothetical protein